MCCHQSPISISAEVACPGIVCETDATPLCDFIPFENCKDAKCDNIVFCFVDPCEVTSCPLFPDAKCISNYCGGCNAIFINPKTKEVSCQGALVRACVQERKGERKLRVC